MIFSDDTRKTFVDIRRGVKSYFRPFELSIHLGKAFFATFVLGCMALNYQDSALVSFLTFLYVSILFFAIFSDIIVSSQLLDRKDGEITDTTIKGVVYTAALMPDIDRGYAGAWFKSLCINILCDWTLAGLLAFYGNVTTAFTIALLLFFHEVIAVNVYRHSHLLIKFMDNKMNETLQDKAVDMYGLYM